MLNHVKQLIEQVANGANPDRLINEARELTPAQRTTVASIHNKLTGIERAIEDAQSAFEKWQKDERFTPQLHNLKQSMNQVMLAARASLTFIEEL